MSTRTTRSTRTSAKQTAVNTSAPLSKPSKTSGKPHDVETQSGKENKNTKVISPATVAQMKKSTSKERSMSIATPDKMYCTCEKGDDGTPMINCSECKDWLHFSCISLDETDAEDISVYVCPSCSEKTGLHSLMTWEESDCVESSRKSGPTSGSSNPRKRSKTPKGPTFTVPLLKDEEQTPEPEPPSASEDSDDNYVVDTKAKGARGKRRSRRVSYHSDSDLSDIADKPSSRIRKASSPSLKRLAKRGFDGPPTKKAKASNPVDDPTRKYCLGKLDDVFRDIFLRYPQVHSKGEDDAVQVIEKQTENLTEEERNSVLEASKQFADDLEKCVFEIYSEPDKNGVPTAAAKYKDRFRMLQFNLSKVDRVVLHKRIVSGHITPKEISVMSSTDLANEELKQSIKSAEQESLKQSILTKSNAPRTKITHKGLEDIEDISGRDSNRERERQLEEEERMEKERLARLRPVEPRQRTMSVSNPPESPAALSSEGWGAPPAVPTHVPNPTRPPLFLHASSDLATTTGSELELNLADLINIDDEPGSNQVVVSPKDVQEGSEVDAPAVLRSPTGISPFAIQPALAPSTSQPAPSPSAQPPTSRASGFDLNSLWSRSNSTSVPSPSAADTIPEAEPEDQKDVVMDSEPVAANDQDFDMLLEEKEPEKPEIDQATFDALPQIWFGKINMPLDSATPQQTPVIGRQMGGNPIAVTSGQWKTLFPSDTLRIDGRVPVENSAKFLLQMRMNPMKELLAVAFAPAPGSDNSAFKIVSEFLINKGRHGLVFPWGNRPKDHHLGKEMYIIPLLSSHSLPDYVELLDDLCLPAIRTTDYLLGIWILNKGRLASPPPQINPPAPIPHMSPSASILTPPLTSTTPMLPIVPISAPSPIIPNITGPSARRSIDQNALAAELASLTPEQLAFVTQALANTPLTSIAASATPTSTISSNTGPLSSSRVHMPFTQPWGVQLPLDRDGPSSVPPQPAFSQGDGGTNARQDQGRGSRGNRESRGGRGRGRGRGDNYHMNSPVDSGWPRKNTGQRRW